MKADELDAELVRLDRLGKREEVVALLRTYGLFTDDGERAVQEYLAGDRGLER